MNRRCFIQASMALATACGGRVWSHSFLVKPGHRILRLSMDRVDLLISTYSSQWRGSWLGSPGMVRHAHCRKRLHHDAGVDRQQLESLYDAGFAGFRLFKASKLARRDFVSFLGASYFRAVDNTRQYGLSARGLAVNTFTYRDGRLPGRLGAR